MTATTSADYEKDKINLKEEIEMAEKSIRYEEKYTRSGYRIPRGDEYHD